MTPRVWPGKPYPLGATWDGAGVNFALFSEHAERVEVCFFKGTGRHPETARVVLPERTDHVWHGYIPWIRPGALYGFRVYGAHDPWRGHRFNHHKLLLDPYAKAVTGGVRWSGACHGYRLGDADEDLSFDKRDSAAFMPKCVVVDPTFDWEGDAPPRTPWNETVIYEAHVKGLTGRHPAVQPKHRGTYTALTYPAVHEHLRSLGVTAIELLPVHHFLDDSFLVERGLKNYWGYNSIGYFAPEMRYASSTVFGNQVKEFKNMVKRLHQAGFEVILDVVYNHTAEGNHLGPTLSFRGIDNAAYYRLVPHNRRYYMDYTGCGNTLNMMHPRVLQLIMDSLRYWVLEMRVDGFRFDLAAALARELHDVDKLGAFFDIIHQDPVLSQVKLIAEPWDLGEGGYQVGNFPVLWAEWNGKYRDNVRSFWKGDAGQAAEMAYRLTGSSDLYSQGGRRPQASVNYVCSHDGFTLRDSVTYNHRHNEANGEGNRDGHHDNRSWNCGVEGETADEAISALRARQQRNLVATLFLSQGVPMLLGGDEFGRTQRGNNNAYCQDNDISWFDWDWNDEQRAQFEFAKKLVALRRAHPSLRRRKFFQGRALHESTEKDISWLRPDGGEMTSADWRRPETRALGLRLCGDCVNEVDLRGEPILDDTLLILLNADHRPTAFTLPALTHKQHWQVLLDTRVAELSEDKCLAGEAEFELEARSLSLLRVVESELPQKAAAKRLRVTARVRHALSRLIQPGE